MLQIHHFRLEGPTPTCHITAAATDVKVIRGRLWMTVEGDETDYWLDAGQAISVPAGARLWLGADAGLVDLEIASPATRQRPVLESRHATRQTDRFDAKVDVLT